MRYYKMYSESLEGQEGEFFCEIDDNGLLVRQIQVFGNKLYWATDDEEFDDSYPIGDQPEFNPKEYDCQEISVDLFEKTWQKSLNQ